MKKLIMMSMLTVTLGLSACSTYQEVSVNEEENKRTITVEQAGELEIPLDVERALLFRATDPLNAHLLGVEPAGINEILINNKYIQDNLSDVEFIKPGDIEKIETIDPDLIITYAPDDYSKDYVDIAPTIEMIYNSSFLSPYKKRVYLTHFYHLGVMLNKEEEAKEKIDDWFMKMSELKRELPFDAKEFDAVVLTEIDGGYQIVPKFGSFGTEAVYDVLEFNLNKEAKRLMENNATTIDSLDSLKDFETDYVFLSSNKDQTQLSEQVKNETGIDESHIIILNLDDYRTNDLISIEGQTKDIIEIIK
ncbi:ABC transporter substrate-binding protein [Phocicoccus pinnipedialis]|uniref:Periplasmic binding protein n=1 Tax=Phocicoccus pinnipedialis TaxID=110845 RepID=A0A6V7R9V1_9BACL|nr:hypothetical protein [Jeotgalicoccus pinnipedialis]MBP1940188.1 iron complex transport system substrate-binding protein [Jeotgalicoccus pinnipedialis]CAD2073923.1 Periplasmic binding protein [Jeotgalicoccus pinnipedialis]